MLVRCSGFNYFRDYDPATGRYLESDPIGLEGGLNTYAYAGSLPVSSVDPRGLSAALFVPGVIIAYAYYELYCVKTGIDNCAARYPDFLNPLNRAVRAQFAKCQQAVVTICGTLGAYGQDPIGSAAAEVGAEVGRRLDGR